MLITFTKSSKRILYISPVINNDITSINTEFINEGVLVGVAKYSYSFDDVNWSDWLSDSDFITSLSMDESYSITTCIRVLIESKINDGSVYSNKQYNSCCVDNIVVNGFNHSLLSVEYFIDTNIIRTDDNINKYDPYSGLSNAHHIREQLSQSISAQFSKKSTYFITKPDETTKSITFKSYRVLNTLEPKEVQVMLNIEDDYNSDVQSYQFYSDYENLEIEILKSEFKNVFGDVTPSPKDVIFINVINKMFRVVSAKEDRNFVNKSVAYKLSLGKYKEVVDVNNDFKQNTDDFSEFTVYDLEDSDEHYNEIEDATGINDSVVHFTDDLDTEYSNNNTKMVYAINGIENVETGLLYNGVNYQRYMYHIKTNEYITKYSLNNTENTYTTAFWCNPLSVTKSIKLLELSSTDTYSELLYFNANGYLTLHLNTTEYNKYITLVGTPIIKGNFYGVLYSRFNNTIILKVLQNNNGVITVVQEILKYDVVISETPTILSICGDINNNIGNIRFMNKSIHNNNVIDYMTDYNPSTTDNIVIDNCNSTITGYKVTVD